jgi:hypothetical protein
MKNEFHPRAVLKRISEGSLDFLPSSFHDDSEPMCDTDDVEEFFEDDDDGGSLRKCERSRSDRWGSLSPLESPKKLLSRAVLNKMRNENKTLSSDQLKFLSFTTSPRTLKDFPLPPTLVASTVQSTTSKNK